jgi:NADPH-dependent 2,4-dienoyl-CoA reductase/sulfur reductase-like enzyme
MVGAAGMCDTLISFAAVQGSALSGNDLVGRVLGDSEGRRMVEELLREQKEHVRRLMGANRHLVEALRDALLDQHELIGHEITDVLAAAGPARPVPATESTVVGASPPETIDLVALERDVQQGTSKGANPPRT